MPTPRPPSDRYHPLITDPERWEAAIAALAREHLPALLELVSDGAILPIRAGTPVAVEADLATRILVRVEEGPDAGRRGWLPSALLRHFPPARIAA